MSTTNLSSAAIKIRQKVYELGTMTIGQVHEMFPSVNPSSINFYIMSLYKKQFIKIVNEKYIVPFVETAADEIMADSLWVMLDKANKDDQDEVIDTCFRGENPVKVCFMAGNILYEVVPITKYSINNINLIAEKNEARSISKEKADEGTRYVFLIDTPDMLSRIAEFDIQFPHLVALAEHSNEDTMPKITYYEA